MGFIWSLNSQVVGLGYLPTGWIESCLYGQVWGVYSIQHNPARINTSGIMIDGNEHVRMIIPDHMNICAILYPFVIVCTGFRMIDL